MSATPAFVADARRFAAEEARHPAFRLMRLYFGCGEEELAQVAAKVWCESVPENTYAIPENGARRALGLLAFAFTWPLRKAWLWRPEPPRDWILETIDGPYFRRWFSRLFAALPGSKAVSPRGPFDEPGIATVPVHTASVRARDGLALMLLSPFMTLAIGALSRRRGIDLRQAYRQMITLHTVWRGFFARHPCRDFVTFDDETNPPVRALARRREGVRRYIVVQNGERSVHPRLGFGMMDLYFVFGPAYERILRSIGTDCPEFVPTGALCLNYHHDTIAAARARGGELLHDVLMIDQGIFPYNGLNERSGRSLETMMERLGEFKRKHPGLRVGYQLRKYHPEQADLKRLLLETLRRRCGDGVAILDNDDGVQSYRAVLRSEVVLTFESTLGFESLMLGRKTLFCNFSGDPNETLCADPAFQHEDPAADYGRFEAKLLALLAAPPLAAPPAVAAERHFATDGRVQERIAERLLARP